MNQYVEIQFIVVEEGHQIEMDSLPDDYRASTTEIIEDCVKELCEAGRVVVQSAESWTAQMIQPGIDSGFDGCILYSPHV